MGVRRAYQVILTMLTMLMVVMHGVGSLKMLLLPNVFLAVRRLGSPRSSVHTGGDRYSSVKIQIG